MHVCFLILSTKSYKIRQIKSAFEKTKRFCNKNFLAVVAQNTFSSNQIFIKDAR